PLFCRGLQQNREALVPFVVAHGAGRYCLVRHVVHAGLAVDDRLEGRMDRDVLHPLAVDPDFATVAQAGAILVSGSDHAYLSPISKGDVMGAGRAVKRANDPNADTARSARGYPRTLYGLTHRPLRSGCVSARSPDIT